MSRTKRVRALLVGGPMYDPLYDAVPAFERETGYSVEIVAPTITRQNTLGTRLSHALRELLVRRHGLDGARPPTKPAARAGSSRFLPLIHIRSLEAFCGFRLCGYYEGRCHLSRRVGDL